MTSEPNPMDRYNKIDYLIESEVNSMSMEDLRRIASEQLFAQYRDESDEYIDEQYDRHKPTEQY